MAFASGSGLRRLWAAVAVCRVALVPGAFDAQSGGRWLRSEDYFADYREYFARRGCEVLTVALAGDAKCEVRALQLRDQLARWNRGHEQEPFALIAHSQGGLDARFAVATLGVWPSAILTVGTPHLGTPLADFVTRSSLARWWVSQVLSLGGYDLDALRFPGEMTADFLRQKSAYFRLHPQVRYGAAQGYCRAQCGAALRFLAWWKVGEGDGLVSVASQRGEVQIHDLGSYNLDHLTEVGADSDKRSERLRLLDAFWSFVRNEVANP